MCALVVKLTWSAQAKTERAVMRALHTVAVVRALRQAGRGGTQPRPAPRQQPPNQQRRRPAGHPTPALMPQRQRKRPARRGPDLRWPAPGTRHAGRQRAPGTPGRQRPRGSATRRAAHAASPSQRATLRRDPPARVAGVDGEVARGPPFPHSTCRAGRAGRLACPRHGGSRAIGAGAGPDFTHLRRAGTRAPPAQLRGSGAAPTGKASSPRRVSRCSPPPSRSTWPTPTPPPSSSAG